MAIQSQLARQGCMVMAFLSLGSSVMAFMSRLSCHGYTITTCLLLLSGHGVPVAVFLSWLSCHSYLFVAVFNHATLNKLDQDFYKDRTYLSS
jgi:hypothetical protein